MSAGSIRPTARERRRDQPPIWKSRSRSWSLRALDGFSSSGYSLLVKVREVIATIEEDGWQLVRTRGSHRQFRHPIKPGTVTVSGKAGLDVPIGTLGSIWKQAGLRKN